MLFSHGLDQMTFTRQDGLAVLRLAKPFLESLSALASFEEHLCILHSTHE